MFKSIDQWLTRLEASQRRTDGVTAVSDIKVHIAPIYYPLHDDIQAAGHQYYNLPGGRGSCKSSFVSLEIVDGIMKDRTGQSNAIVFRRTANTMRESVYSQIAWAIETLGAGEFWRGNVSPMTYTFLPTGAQIIFRGLDDPSKLKSIKPRKGIFRYVWLEEFAELPGENFSRSIMQSVVRGGEAFTVFRSFNPPLSKTNWANQFVLLPDPRSVTLHTTYLDIPREWLGEAFIYEADRLKEVNEQAYRHEYLGEATGSGGEVFPNIESREITDEEIKEMQYIYAGIDWGFSVDPAAFVRVSYDKKTDRLFIIDEIVGRHWSNQEFADKIKERGFHLSGEPAYQSLWMGATGEQRQLIVCDSAEPKSIADVQAAGLKAVSCRKYPGSVMYGIKWLQHRHIIIDPKRTPCAHKEFTRYEYERTRDGEFLASVPDAGNHCIDAVRYACERLINNKTVPA